MKKKLGMAVSALVLAACMGPFSAASSLASITEMELELDANGHLRVPVGVGDAGTFDFILDTAASRTGVMQPLVQELNWQPREGERVIANGIAGATEIDMYAAQDLAIGNELVYRSQELPGMGDLTIPGDPFYGILGSDFFENYVVEIDAPGELIRFSETEASSLIGSAANDFSSAEISEIPEMGIWQLQVMIGEMPVTALLDTGARGSLMNRAAAEALGVDLPPPPAPGEGEDISGAAGHHQQGIGLQIGEISVGTRTWENVQLLVSDVHVFDVIGLGDVPAMILGSDLLFDGRLVVDYADGRVYIENAE